MADITYSEARRTLKVLVEEATARRSDQFYLSPHYDVQQLASDATRIFLDKNNKAERSQMKGLENIALSANSFSDIIDYIKNQTGRSTRTGDQWRDRMFGLNLHNALWHKVRERAEQDAETLFKKAQTRKMARALEAEDYDRQDLERELRLLYARSYIQHLVAHFVYQAETS